MLQYFLSPLLIFTPFPLIFAPPSFSAGVFLDFSSGFGGAGFADNRADHLVDSSLLTLDPSLPSRCMFWRLPPWHNGCVDAAKSKATGWNCWRRWMLPLLLRCRLWYSEFLWPRRLYRREKDRVAVVGASCKLMF